MNCLWLAAYDRQGSRRTNPQSHAPASCLYGGEYDNFPRLGYGDIEYRC